jgi:hypothetical protein
MKFLILILDIIISYELSKIIINKKTLSKINKYFLHKNEKYYEDLLDYYDKNKKINSTKKLNVISQLSILINKTELRRNSYYI